jgi:GR25 family glycosyltransferase involved in LPS biosynthesis
MLARYINLREAVERRTSLEANIRALPAGKWQVARFEAIDTSRDETRHLPGSASPAEKACYLSHRALLTEMLHAGAMDPFFVWEDDVLVGQLTHEAAVSYTKSVGIETWDLLFTDIVVPDLNNMLLLLTYARRLRSLQKIEALDLRSIVFAGTTSYLVNPTALPKLIKLLSGIHSLDKPLDLQLRQWIHQGLIKAHVLFPFVTTVADAGLKSQISPEDTNGTDLAWNLYRRLVWWERNTQELHPLCNRLASIHPDAESSIMGIISAALISPHFVPK